jgi:hypothetical protein
MNQMAKANGLRGWGAAGDILSEGVEETMDEVLSDVFSAMQSDSRTWNEDVWANISSKWKDYVKAGVLGAIGGGMGASIQAAKSPGETFGKSTALKQVEAQCGS